MPSDESFANEPQPPGIRPVSGELNPPSEPTPIQDHVQEKMSPPPSPWVNDLRPWSDADEIPLVRAAPQPPQPGFWMSCVWCVLFMLLLNGVALVVMLAGIMFEAFSHENPRVYLQKFNNKEYTRSAEFEELNARLTAPGLLIGEVVTVIASLLVIRMVVGRDWARQLAFRRPSVSHVILVLLGFPAMMMVSNAVHLVAEKSLPGFDYQESVAKMITFWPVSLGVLIVGVGPGFIEELWFRGFLGRGLVGRYGAIGGVLLTSGFFGLMHLDPPSIVATGFLGMLLHLVYLWSRSIWLPMLLHFLNNSVGVCLAHLSDPSEPLPPLPKTMLIAFGGAGLLLAVGWAMYRSRVGHVWNGDTEGPPWQPPYPGVEHPPAHAAADVVRPWPGWTPSGFVLGGVSMFVACFMIAAYVLP